MDSAAVAAVRGHVVDLVGERTTVCTGTQGVDLVALALNIDSAVAVVAAVAGVVPAVLKAFVAVAD